MKKIKLYDVIYAKISNRQTSRFQINIFQKNKQFYSHALDCSY